MGLEYLTQPQVFTAPITALQGIQGVNEAYPLLTTYQYWTSTAVIPTSTFPIPGLWTMLSDPGSFLIAIDGILQPATEYSIDRDNRQVLFNSLVSADLEVAFTQLATNSPSSQSFNYLKSVSADFEFLSATNLLVTNLTALSSVLQVTDITQYEISGFNVQGNANVAGNVNVTGTVSATNVNALNITLTDNGSLVGQTSATTMNVGFLSARGFDLIHTPANDGVDPIFNFGETGTEGLSGIRVRYDEGLNDIFITSRTGSTILTSAVIDVRTGQVGISGMPNAGQTLTVAGNVSASGNIAAANTPLYYYLDNNRPAVSGSTIPPLGFTTFFDSSASLLLLPNKAYEVEYNLFFSRNATTPIAFALSSNPSLNHVAAIGFQSPAGGFTVPWVNTPGTSLGTGIISALPGSFIPILSTSTLVANASYYVRLVTQVQTSATSIPFTTLNIQASAGFFPGNTSAIFPLKGSTRKVTLIN